MTQVPYELDLRDLMDARYGAGKWTGRTAIGVGTNIGPAINDGAQQFRATNGMGGIIKIPPGLAWMMSTPPDPLLLGGVVCQGVHSQASEICFNNANAAMFHYRGMGNTGGGLEGLGLLLEDGMGDTDSTAILLDGSATFQSDNMIFRDIRIATMSAAAPSYWWNGVQIDGSARTHPQGVRVGELDMVQIFNCRNVPLYGANMVQWNLTNVGCYTGKGVYGNDIILEGRSTHIYGEDCNFVNLRADPTTSVDVMINGKRYS